MTRRLFTMLCSAGLLSGCSGAREADPAAGAGLTGDAPGTTSTEGSTTTGDGTDAATATDTDTDGVKFDVGGGPDLGGAGDDGTGDGCEKIDFLFVIDNSISMGGAQSSLVASFPGFIHGIRDTVDVDDYHILITDTDWNGGPNYGDYGGGTNLCDTLCADEPDGSCENQPCSPFGCDGMLGSGLLRDKAKGDCGVTSGQRYMTSDQPSLEATFACIAEVGTDGAANEMTMQSAISAVTDRVASGECNEGFLRDDAILVITMISDEPHSHDYPKGGPPDWAQSFVTAKNDNEEAIVVLAIVNDADVPGGKCVPGTFDGAPLYRAWAETFPHGQWASVCEPDYSPFFLDAVSVIDSACDEFDPPG